MSFADDTLYPSIYLLATSLLSDERGTQPGTALTTWNAAGAIECNNRTPQRKVNTSKNLF